MADSVLYQVSSFAAAQGMKCLEIDCHSEENISSLLALLSELMMPLVQKSSFETPVKEVAYPEIPRDVGTWNAIVDYIRSIEEIARRTGSLPPRPPGL